ncbi:MAG: hypothetical protein J7J88_00155 [Dehalococcoidia bacterium]|nr:hypothetical protein [Dehalococcoidia bacterium]
MNIVELSPFLSHCIEATARDEFGNVSRTIIQSASDSDVLEERFELLKAFLETADFKKLRCESEKYLIQGKSVKFEIYWQEGHLAYDMLVA